MTDVLTISEVTKAFNVSTRTLRYYEQIGLLESVRTEDYAYRAYGDAAVKRLRQIILLRKLRIPLKQIAEIFNDGGQRRTVEIFTESLAETTAELAALRTIRDVLRIFVSRLNAGIKANTRLDLLKDSDIVGIIESLSLSRINFKEEKSMNEINKASETLSGLRNVRILYLPPATVAASRYFGENPENEALKRINGFVKETKLSELKPDLRLYGFNNPSPVNGETYGYEFWVTIPEDTEVREPLVKKHFAGGLYAAHAIKMGDFHEWRLLGEWVEQNPDYEYDPREPLGMGGCLEEALNVYSYYASGAKSLAFAQLDLLTPVKEKAK